MRLSVLLSALLLTAPLTYAQTVDEIVAKNLEAKGGVEILKNTTTVRTEAKGTVQGAEVTITTLSKRPHFVRNEMQRIGPAGTPQKNIMGFDGTTMWVAMGGTPAQALPQGPQTESFKQTSQIDSPLLDYKSKGTTIELAPGVTEGGRKLHRLVVRPVTGPALHYYIDAVTNLESKMIIEAEENGQKMTMEMRFSDFRTVDGRTVPFTVTQFMNGREAGTMKYTKIEFNAPLDDALFEMPK